MPCSVRRLTCDPCLGDQGVAATAALCAIVGCRDVQSQAYIDETVKSVMVTLMWIAIVALPARQRAFATCGVS